MEKIAVMVAPGFEEGETLSIIDILRRAGYKCDSVGFTEIVTGGHQITMKCDKVLGDSLQDYQMIVLPGGYEGATALRDNDYFIQLLQAASQSNKWVAAMCAAPIVLDKAGLLENKAYTAYLNYDKKINAGDYKEDIVVIDGKLITSRGPATVYAFSYALIDVLGGDSQKVKERMVYLNSFDEKQEVLYV